METSFSEEDDYLMAKNIILRNYQINVIEEAKKQNSILFLPTGTGKTLIAIQILCSKTSEIIGEFPEKGKRVFFVAPTKVLVYQLHKDITVHTKFKVKCFVGDMLVDYWDKQNWQEQFKNYQVIVLTGEILRQIIELKCIAFNQISLIVFDECHHATLQHPYNIILQNLAKEPYTSSPLLLGLSAVLLNLNAKKKDVLKEINDLKTAFRGVILTNSDVNEIKRFASKPQEKLVPYKSSTSLIEKFIPVFDEIINLLNDLVLLPLETPSIPKTSKFFKNRNRARRLKNWFANAKEILEDCGLYCGALAVLYYIILVEKLRLTITDPEEIQVLVYCRTALHKLRHILLNVIGEETEENIFKHSSNKIQTLLNLLINSNKTFGKNHVASLVFVRQKATAVTIAIMLKKLKEINNNFSFLKPEFIIGENLYDKETLLHEFNNEKIIKEFSSQNLNTLISTNVLEEGINITICNIVVSFDFPSSYSSYFQSRGRARDREGVYYVFVKEEEIRQKSTILNEYKEIEEELYKIILAEGKKCTIENLGLEENDDEISSMVIRAVYKYCGQLPQDRYSYLTPLAWYTEVTGGKKASVLLPMNCPIQGVIEGEVMPNSKAAKKSAFLTTLKKLIEIGEIDENGLEIVSKVKAKCFDYLFPHYKKENIEKNSPLPGTKKRRQNYEVKFAKSLSECLPQPGQKAYLHVIDFAIKFDKIEREDKLLIQEVLQSPVTFAILSSKKLCRICQFPMFLSMGQIDCNLLVNHDVIILSQSELEDIKLFHFSIFQKVLKIIKNSQVFDNRNKGHSFYIVPVNKNEFGRFTLNWEVICSDFCRGSKSAIVRYNPIHSRNIKRNIYDLTSRETLQMSNAMVPLNMLNEQNFWRASTYGESNHGPEFVMSEAEYKYFVISPNYRNVQPQTYIVQKFCYDLSPLSPFPNSVYPDYCAYYQDKYMIEISNVKQPLMKVAYVFTCSNFNRPKYFGNKKKGRGTVKNYDELLVPELCDILPFDRRYWLKALLLPTALNRLCHLYCVEEFRWKIINETGLGQIDTAKCEFPEFPKNLEVDFTLNNHENDSESVSMPLKMDLPLSRMKSKSKTDLNFIDIKRNILEVSVCDLEYFVSFLEGNKFEEEIIDSFPLCFEVDDALIKLKNKQQYSIPSLRTLKRSENKVGPDLAYLLQAMVSPAANDIISYERLEILGDAFLKFAATIFLFRNLNSNEGILTFLKGKMVGNRNLLYCGLAKGFQHVLDVTDFAPLSDWNPPLMCLPEKLVDAIISNNTDPAVIYRWDIPPDEQFSGNLSYETLSKNEEIIRNYDKACDFPVNSLLPYKSISDKTISDSVEAVIGIYLTEFGLPGGFEILMWLDILPKNSGSYFQLIEKDYTTEFPNLAAVMNILQEVFYMDLEEILGYQFKNKMYLLEAITHPSYTANRVTHCYQRLEFLGDAVLDFLITCYIYEYCGDLTPGQITDIRSSLVNNVTFACLSVRYGFHKYLLKLSSRLNNIIEEFVKYQASKNHVIDDNVLILLEEDDCLIAESVQVPKALGDVFESLAGAIYLDSGNSLETVWAVFYRLMKEEIENFTKSVPKNSVRLLHEICKETPNFETVEAQDRTQVICTVWYDNAEIKVYGFGSNKKEAKRSAAKFALKKISELKK